MANGEDEIRPRTITAANVWEAFDRLRDENREARHSQNNYIAGVIGAESKETRGIIEGLDGRLRVVENSIATVTPTSLGERINKLETWRAVADGQTNLPNRVDVLEGDVAAIRASQGEQRAEIRGAVRVFKIGMAILSAIVVIGSVIALFRPAVIA